MTVFQQRSAASVFWLGVFTGGLYLVYWAAQTKGELVKAGGDVPTAWLLIVPVANIWWLWKYAEATEHVTSGKLGKVFVFAMLIIATVGAPVLQAKYNGVTA